MPNGETAAASGAVSKGNASRIGYVVGQVGSSKRMQAGKGTAGTTVRVNSSKPKGYSTERAAGVAKSNLKASGKYSAQHHGPKAVSTAFKNDMNRAAAKKRTKKGRKKKKSA